MAIIIFSIIEYWLYYTYSYCKIEVKEGTSSIEKSTFVASKLVHHEYLLLCPLFGGSFIEDSIAYNYNMHEIALL